MSLVRVWRRQLYGATSVALIVPAAMLAALMVLALGGGFSQLGVLGQVFAGPPAPSGSVGSGGAAVRSLPVIPGASGVAVPSLASRRRAGMGVALGGRRTPAAGSAGGSRQAGGALTSSGGTGLTPSGGTAPIVTVGGGAPSSAPARPSPASPVRSSPPPGPSPQPRPTPVDQVVKVVTSVTQRLPAPVGPVATQAVQAAGSAADGLLPSGGGSPAVQSLP